MGVFAWFRERHFDAQIASASLVEVDGTKRVEVQCARPGILIGKRGATIEKIKEELEKELGPITVNITEVRQMETNPQLVADHVVMNLVRGVAIDRALDTPIKWASRLGAECMISVSGAKGEHQRRTGGFSEANAQRATHQSDGISCTVAIITKVSV